MRSASRPFLQISLCTALIFLLSLKLHGSKLMLKLYYMCVPTSLLTGCDTNVALDSGLYGVHLRTKIIENKIQFEVQKLDYPCRNLVI